MVNEIKYKHQAFQEDAVNAVCDLFLGQPYSNITKYVVDSGINSGNQAKLYSEDVIGFKNAPLDPALTDDVLLDRIRAVQKQQMIRESQNLLKTDECYNFTIQMETGTGKTYVYIKTMLELNKRYGWTKFIVVVPSIAIREGVKSTFESTQKHFAQDYGRKIRFFVYNSSRLSDIDSFANDNSIQAMIINSQAFNATGKDARRIDMELDEFRSRKPIDVIASTNPILIIDEPQSVEGKKTREKLTRFKPFFILRYSATHRSDSLYNMIYRLDPMDAYEKRLVKRIAVKGMAQINTTATDGYVYVEDIQVYKDKPPTAHIGFERKTASRIERVVKLLKKADNLYLLSKELQEYKDNYFITDIDADKNIVSFGNGLILGPGEMVGNVNSDTLRRLQIRETIKSHIEKEQELHKYGIKILSLFFIDEVAKYRQYDDSGNEINGEYGQIFEEEYVHITDELKPSFSKEYLNYIQSMSESEIHKGYFSVDKKGRAVDDVNDKREGTSDDADAYDLIMRKKTLLLDLKNSVRFIFSHSALREGWDNPNVFEICTLKDGGSSDIRKMQEVGRGLRLCVNQAGERMDESVLGDDVQRINELTVVASESYKNFTEGIQRQIAQGIFDRPTKINMDFFKDKKITVSGQTEIISDAIAEEILFDLINNEYVSRADRLPTEKYREARKSGELDLSERVMPYQQAVFELVDSVFDPKAIKIKNGRDDNVVSKINKENFGKQEFLDMWESINEKTAYVVSFDTEELISKCVHALDSKLHVSKVMVSIEEGKLKQIKSKEQMESMTGFTNSSVRTELAESTVNSAVRYDLIGKIVDGTNLTRTAVAAILMRIKEKTFDNFGLNPEEFITNSIKLIEEEKGAAIIQSITYCPIDESYDTEIFTSTTIRGKLGTNMMESKKSIYDYVAYDSTTVERPFAERLESSEEVIVYVKIPTKEFKIHTPLGDHTPDWAIVFKKGITKHVYFVAETKGSLNSLDLRGIESAKVECARRHFESISNDKIRYGLITSYDDLRKLIVE